MKYKDTKVMQGGLMRCCLATLAEFITEHAEEEAVEGTTLACKYHSKQRPDMIFKDGAWRWNATIEKTAQ